MKHTIELNGKHYDAVNGELIHNSQNTIITPSQKSAGSSQQARQTSHHVAATTSQKHTITQHKGTRSRTLMRTIVKKPVITHRSTTAPPTRPVIVTIAQMHTNPTRLARISQIPQSKLITRFGH